MAAYTLGWKVEEPTPPLACTEDDLWLFPEDSVKTNISEPNNFGTLNKRELAEQLLEDIDSIVKSEEYDKFSDWIEETIDLHLFDEIQPVVPEEEPKSGAENTVVDTTVETTDLTQLYTPEDTSNSCVDLNYDSLNPVEFPSETTPDCTYQTLSNLVLSPDDNLAEIQSLPDQPGLCTENTSQPSAEVLTVSHSPLPDIEKEMEIMEEIIRRSAQSIGNHQIVIWEFRVSNLRRIRPTPSRDDDSNDSDWLPPSNKRPKKSPLKKSKSNERPKTQEDRVNRKKEQNKVAAVRYRQRKKAELKEMLTQEKALENRRNKLRLRLAELKTEIKYMKSILRDLFMNEVN